MKNRNFILALFSILSVSIVLTGCYSFRPISVEQLKSNTSPRTFKFILNDSSEVLFNEEDSIYTSAPDTILIVKLDSTKQKIAFENISKIYEERFDGGKTFLSSFWILFGLLALVAQFFRTD